MQAPGTTTVNFQELQQSLTAYLTPYLQEDPVNLLAVLMATETSLSTKMPDSPEIQKMLLQLQVAIEAGMDQDDDKMRKVARELLSAKP